MTNQKTIFSIFLILTLVCTTYTIDICTASTHYFFQNKPPVVLKKSPVGPDANLDTNITIKFSSPMDTKSVEDAVKITPSVKITAYCWSDENTNLTIILDTLNHSTYYCIVINSSIARSKTNLFLDGNENGICEKSPIDDFKWYFTTVKIMDTRPPVLFHEQRYFTAAAGKSIQLEVQITDDTAVLRAYLFVKPSTGREYTKLNMELISECTIYNTSWQCEIPAALVTVGTLYYYFEALDYSHNIGRTDVKEPYRIEVTGDYRIIQKHSRINTNIVYGLIILIITGLIFYHITARICKPSKKLVSTKITVSLFVIMLLSAIFWSAYFVPSLKKYPESINLSTVFEGTIQMRNTTTLKMDKYNISFEFTFKSNYSIGKDIILVDFDQLLYNTDYAELIYSSFDSFAVDRNTGFHVQNAGSANRCEYALFPIGVDKKTYLQWMPDVEKYYKIGGLKQDGCIITLNYVRDELHNGIHTYLFEGSSQSLAGSTIYEKWGVPVGSTERYILNQKFWVEPNTGLVVDCMKNYTVYVKLPDLFKVADFDTTTILNGTIKILNTTTFRYETFDARANFHVWSCGLMNDTLLVGTEIDIYKLKTGEKFNFPEPMSLKPTIDYINPRTMQFVSDYYTDTSPEGYIWMPPKVEKKKYLLYNPLLRIAVEGEFLEEELHNNIHTYKFVFKSENMSIGTMQFDNLTVNLTYTGVQYSWYEPLTGTEVDRISDGVVYCWLDENIAIVGLELYYQFAEQSVKECALNLPAQIAKKSLSELEIKIIDLDYRFSDETILKTVEFVKSILKTLVFIEIYIPVLTAVIAILLFTYTISAAARRRYCG